MRYFPIILLILLNVLAGCLISGVGRSDSNEIQMFLAPIQCMGNPWEQDWLATHDNRYHDYPADPSIPGLEPEEKTIIKAYYAKRGIRIESLSTHEWDGAVCLACSCAAGYTLIATVDESQRERMLDEGFTEDDPHH